MPPIYSERRERMAVVGAMLIWMALAFLLGMWLGGWGILMSFPFANIVYCLISGHWWAKTTPKPEVNVSPITHDGETLLVDTNRMSVGIPYGLIWRGKPAFAYKLEDGSIELWGPPDD